MNIKNFRKKLKINIKKGDVFFRYANLVINE